jgi:hypothetical protein
VFFFLGGMLWGGGGAEKLYAKHFHIPLALPIKRPCAKAVLRISDGKRLLNSACCNSQEHLQNKSIFKFLSPPSLSE